MHGVFAGHEIVGGFAGARREREEVFTSDFKSVGLIKAEGDGDFTPDVNRDFWGGCDQGVIEGEIEEIATYSLALMTFEEIDAMDVFGEGGIDRAELDKADGDILIEGEDDMVLDEGRLDVIGGKCVLEMMVEVFRGEIGICFGERFSGEGEEGLMVLGSGLAVCDHCRVAHFSSSWRHGIGDSKGIARRRKSLFSGLGR